MTPEEKKAFKEHSRNVDALLGMTDYYVHPNYGYCNPFDDNFAAGAAKIDDVINELIDLLPNTPAGLSVIYKLQGIRDHMLSLSYWIEDNLGCEQTQPA